MVQSYFQSKTNMLSNFQSRKKDPETLFWTNFRLKKKPCKTLQQVKCVNFGKKKLYRMRATGEFKVFRFKVLQVAWSEPQRKRGGQLLIQ